MITLKFLILDLLVKRYQRHIVVILNHKHSPALQITPRTAPRFICITTQLLSRCFF